MKFKINRDHFSVGLQQVLNVVGSRATMPILSNVLIEASDGFISLSTTNLDMGIRCRIKADIKDPGAVTLPVRRLATIVRELPNIDVSLESSPSHQTKIASGSSTFRIMGIGQEEFPPLPAFTDERSFVMRQEDLSRMLKSVSYAQSSDETRYILNGVYFSFQDDRLNLVATDGRRLALIGKELEFPPEHAGNIIIPAKTVTELLRLLDKGKDVKVAFSERQVAFEIGTEGEGEGLADNIYLVSKIVEGSYPNYQQVVPKETHQRIKIDRELLLQCVHRVALVTSDKSNTVKVKAADNHLEISASSPDFGEAHESLAVEYNGPEIQVAFNPQFMMDPLKALPHDEVYLEIKDELSPGVFKTLDSFICVIMPLRLN